MRTVVVVLFSFSGWLLCFSQLYLAADTLNAGQKSTGNQILVSIKQKFQLGFFSPPGSIRKYLGIWYYGSEPQTIVWVANRDDPVVDSTGVFQISEDGNLMVLDANGRSHWSSGLQVSSSTNRTVKLMDSGNLMLRDDDLQTSLWQSFEHPTDTFLADMKMDKDLVLTSWRDSEDPGSGNFTFKLGKTGDNLYRIYRNQTKVHWEGGMPSKIVNLLTNFSLPPSNYTLYNKSFSTVPHRLNYQYTRLVMNSSGSGEIQFLRWDNITGGWYKDWWEPADKCEIYNACGSFSSCNINNIPVCKCLPGFNSTSQENQFPGELFHGCVRISDVCNKKDSTFLSLKTGKVRNSGIQVTAASESDCQSECLKMCPQCQAYSYNARGLDRSPYPCLIWTENLPTLREEHPDDDGIDLSVRVTESDIAPTAKTCEPCNTITIPYPLSTRPDCGDPQYLKLRCEKSTGKLSFLPLDDHLVTKIDPNSRQLFIKVEGSNYCEVEGQRKQLDSPFNVTNWCFGEDEIEVSWLPPPEPPCNKSIDCQSWAHSTCKDTTTRDGKQRCLCDTNYHWNNSTLSCTQADSLSLSKEASRRKNPQTLILVLTLSSMSFLACIIVFAYVWRRKIARKKDRESVQRNRGHLYDSERHVKDLIDMEELEEKNNEGIEVPYFDFESILAATDNFSEANKLGRGGYGPVYKGTLPGGQDIAVKRLSNVSSQGLKEFKNEVVLIAKLQHRNLVRLRGYCIKRDEKILLYEYMSNKSLDLFIFDPTQRVLLDWQMRFDIILGVTRGMLYLHQDSRLRVIHRDLKTSNILLDEEMQPKISDFGLAKIFGGKETEANTDRIVGTYGYMSPEYALDGLFSVKSDVFSFGVVLLEIISGKKNTGFFQSKKVSSLLGYAWRLWVENKLLDLMDQSLSETCNANQFIKCAHVSLLCVQDEPGDRPTMSNVVIMLESETATLPTPKQPTFFMSRGLSSTASSSSKPEAILQTESSYQQGR